jgi:hypothetical protein
MLIPSVTRDGQPFVDEYAPAHKAQFRGEFPPNPVAAALSGAKPMPFSFNRVPLRWMKPDGNGGVVPRLETEKEPARVLWEHNVKVDGEDHQGGEREGKNENAKRESDDLHERNSNSLNNGTILSTH